MYTAVSNGFSIRQGTNKTIFDVSTFLWKNYWSEGATQGWTCTSTRFLNFLTQTFYEQIRLNLSMKKFVPLYFQCFSCIKIHKQVLYVDISINHQWNTMFRRVYDNLNDECIYYYGSKKSYFTYNEWSWAGT